MKKQLTTICFAILLLACNSEKNKSQSTNSNNLDHQTESNLIKITDISQYDPLFIEGLKEYENPIILNENYIEIENEKVTFPEVLSLQKPTIFTGNDKQYNYKLILNRQNLTNVNYEFVLTDKNGKNIDQISGTAILPSLFFLGADSFEDESNESHLAVVYNDFKKDKWVNIMVASSVDNHLHYLAKISYGNETENSTIFELEDSPILRSAL